MGNENALERIEVLEGKLQEKKNKFYRCFISEKDADDNKIEKARRKDYLKVLQEGACMDNGGYTQYFGLQFLKKLIPICGGIMIAFVVFIGCDQRESRNHRTKAIEVKRTTCYYLKTMYEECKLRYPQCGKYDLDMSYLRWQKCEEELKEMKK